MGYGVLGFFTKQVFRYMSFFSFFFFKGVNRLFGMNLVISHCGVLSNNLSFLGDSSSFGCSLYYIWSFGYAIDFFRFGFLDWTSGLRCGARQVRTTWCYIIRSLNVINDHRVKKIQVWWRYAWQLSYKTEYKLVFWKRVPFKILAWEIVKFISWTDVNFFVKIH